MIRICSLRVELEGDLSWKLLENEMRLKNIWTLVISIIRGFCSAYKRFVTLTTYMVNIRGFLVFPKEVAKQLIDKSFFAAQVVATLIKRLRRLRVPLFHYTIKLHYCLHIALATQSTNPFMGDCSSGEELMKACKKLIKESVFVNSHW